MGNASYPYNLHQKEASPVPLVSISSSTSLKEKGYQVTRKDSRQRLLLDPSYPDGPLRHSSTMAPHLEPSA